MVQRAPGLLTLLPLLLLSACGEPSLLECLPPSMEAVVGSSVEVRVDCFLEPPDEKVRLRLETLEVSSPFEARIDGGGQVRVIFTPEAAGPASGVLTVRHRLDGEAQPPLEVALSAVGLSPLDWEAGPEPLPCPVDTAAPLLEQALALAGLDLSTFGFDELDLASSGYWSGGWLDDPFLLSWFLALREAPARAGCFAGELVRPLDHHLAGRHPVSAAIRQAAGLLDRPVPAGLPVDGRVAGGDPIEALEAICALAGEPCWFPGEGELPPDLGEALAPILWAMADGIAARLSLDETSARGPQWWFENGGHINLIGFVGESPDSTDADDRAYLLGETGRAELYLAAARIAHAVESADWTPFRDRPGVAYQLRTPFGWVRISGGEADVHPPQDEPTLLQLDLGGDDEYLGEVGANRSGDNPVALAIDLGGADTYHYEVRATPHDQPRLPPADEHGRYRADDPNIGPVSRSELSRQGAGRNGIGMLFDLGPEGDTYASLRASQGYAHQGVGVLYDAGGSDTYVGEVGVQGSAQFGIGLSIDAGEGDDLRHAFAFAQGYGYSAGAGLLVDGGGNDDYRCDHGDPNQGGLPLYYSAQLGSNGNSSFCQGAGFGRRGDANRTFWSGGLGVLRDLGGDDTYEASVFAQGTGYWQGTGLLADADGADVYDAYWYVQGAAAHYAIGILTDGGTGDDLFDATRRTRNMSLGSGHDYSVGVLLSEGGADEYNIGTLAVGSSNCNGVGLFVDNAGDDRYLAFSDYSSGMGNVSSECLADRPDAVSIGVMIDAGGSDTYDYPASTFPTPSEGGTWGHARNDLPSEYGAGLDAEGESSLHAE
ncbi:MAG: hypothetical protein P1V51_02545 [Deltaproteobacteria bacterium]|nr:hypothetical protein [Deltaproteobacteria bacterium]